MRKTKRWMMGAVVALPGVMVVAGCGEAEEKPAADNHTEGDGHKEGDEPFDALSSHA